MTEVEFETQDLRVQVLASCDLATTSLKTESEMTNEPLANKRAGKAGTGMGSLINGVTSSPRAAGGDQGLADVQSLEGLFAPSAVSGSCLRDLQGSASHRATCYLPLWMPQALYYQGLVKSRYLNVFAKVTLSFLKSLFHFGWRMEPCCNSPRISKVSSKPGSHPLPWDPCPPQNTP